MASKGVELASAYISLNVSTDKVPRQVQQALAGVRDVDIDVDAKTAGAEANMARFRTGQERRPVNIKVDVDTKGASNQMRGLRRDIESLGRSDFLKLNIGAAGIASLPALATGLAEVAAAMQQVAQASLVIPGGIAGAASSIGTLVFGLTGVSDAYDAVSKASDEAATSGGDVAAQARAQLSASNSLRNAVVDEAQARRDVARATRDARNELTDLNIEMRGGVLSEKRAVLEAQKAREDLASGRFTDLRDQLLRVEEADQRVLETRARNAQTQEEMADANAKGVANSDQVVAANERLTRSQQNVAEAQASVAAAAPKASAAQEAAALAMSKLHPNAQKLVETMRELATGPGMNLRNMVQGNLLEGVSEQLEGLVSKSLPTFEKGLGRISTAWNKTFDEVFKVLGEDDSLSLLDRIFGNTADAQERLSAAIDPLVEGLGTLAAAGSDALPRLADAFVGASERFADFITAADEDGRLETWINEGIDALGDLGETALNVGKMFTGITGAADGSLLENLAKWTGQWQEFLNSPEGQDKLKNLFAEGKETFNDFKRILQDLPGMLQGIYAAADKYIGGLINVLDPITTFLSNHKGLVEAAAAAYLVFKGATVVGALVDLTTRLTSIDKLLGTTIPASAGKAGGALSTALTGPGVAVILGSWGISALQGKLDELFGTDFFSKYGDIPGSGAWIFKRLFEGKSWNPFAGLFPDDPALPNGTSVGQGPGANANQGDALDPGFFLGAGGNAREFAHGSMMPFWESQGFTVGDHAADQYGEHQNGAIDIMVDNLEEGNKVLQQVLKDPNVYGAIFNNQTFGYGQGSAPRPYSGGNTGNPTQDHQDHVHVWYKPGGGENIAPMPAAGQPSRIGQATQPPAPPVGVPPGAPPAPQKPATIDDFWQTILGPRTFDEGGWWPSGTTGINTTGQPEYVLSPQDLEWLNKQGIDPASVMPHSGNGQPKPPGPPQLPGPMAPDAGVNLEQYEFGSQPSDLAGVNRTQGFIPAGAGFSGKTGGGLAGSLLSLGGEAIKGVIDTAADLGKMAASAAIAGGTMGAGAAAGPAAGMGIDILAGIAKRGVDYATEMGGIGIGALTEILTPFGAPRWLTDVDATSFMPQWGVQPIGTTTGEATGQIHPGISAGLTDGQPAVRPEGFNPAQAMSGAQAGAQAVKTAPPPPPAPITPPTTPPQQQPSGTPPTSAPGGMDFLKMFGLFDSGGVLQPNRGAINLSNRPEYVFTQSQFKAMEGNASHKAGRDGPLVGTMQVLSWDEAHREIRKLDRRASGPTMRGKAGL